MKTYNFKFSLLILLLIILVSSCVEQEAGISPSTENIISEKSKPAKIIDVVSIAPSGDVSGVTDANNIQEALNTAGAIDGTVYLTDGDASTVDHYFVSQGIVVMGGFSGTLTGESKHQTVIEAIKQSDGTSFEFSFNSDYVTDPDNPNAGIWPTAIHFEYPEHVTIRNLTITTQSNPAPGAGYFQHIAIWGGDHNVIISDVRLQGEPGSSWSAAGIHAMAGTKAGSLDGEGSLLITNVDIIDLSDGLAPMWYGDGSTITIDDVSITNANKGIFARGLATGLQITGSTFTASTAVAIDLRSVSNANISGNIIKDQHFSKSWHSGFYLRNEVRNSIFTNNTFDNLGGNLGQAIYLRGYGGDVSGNTIDHNNFTKSGLPGWTADNPDGPGAVRLGERASENYIHEMKFPAGKGKALCQMIWDETDDPTTTDYDGANSIHNWQPCENLAEREIRKLDMELESRY